MRLSLFIARRYLFSRKSHNAINVVTGISVACVAVVTTALIIILSAMNGLSDLVESLYNNFHADIRISPVKGKVFTINEESTAALLQIEGVAWYTEIVDENVLVEANDRQLIVTMRGVQDNYEKCTGFSKVVKQGEFNLHPNGHTGVVAGQEIAGHLGLGEMTPLQLLVPKRDRNLTVDFSNMDEEPFNRHTTFVTGLYTVSSDFDGRFVILPIETVRKLMEYEGGESTSAEMGVKPGTDVDDLIVQIKQKLGPNYKVENRYQQNELLFKTLKSEKAWTFIILLFILLIATFNTIGSLTLLIIEKKKDIGVLWSMGGDQSFIRRVFFTEGLLISATGTIIGSIIGLTLCFLQKQFGFIRFSEGFVVDTYPVRIDGMDILLIIAAVMAIGLVAAWYPVRVYTKRYQSIRFSG
jgi:lipoprotein-releasing system permease protein